MIRALKKALYRQIALTGALFIRSKTKRKVFREYWDAKIIDLHRDTIESFISQYPDVWSEEDTIRHIIEHRSSICRFGDGEFKLIIGERHKSFQDVNEQLNARLLEVLHSNDPNILVGIHPVRNFEGLGRIWQKFIIRIGDEVLNLLDLNRSYPSMGAFRVLPDTDKQAFIDRIQLIKQIWQDRKIVFVVGKNSRFTYEEELFDNAASIDYVYGPAKNAFLKYDNLLNEVRRYNKDTYLIMPILGPTATIMAYDLAKEGYQAIDFGQMTGVLNKIKAKLKIQKLW